MRELLGEQQQLIFVPVKLNSEFVNQVLRGTVPVFQFVILNLGKIREADTNLRRPFG